MMQDLNEQVTLNHSLLFGLPFLQPDSWWMPLGAVESLRGKIERFTDLMMVEPQEVGASEGQGVFLA